jgi:hypothetical protein
MATFSAGAVAARELNQISLQARRHGSLANLFEARRREEEEKQKLLAFRNESKSPASSSSSSSSNSSSSSRASNAVTNAGGGIDTTPVKDMMNLRHGLDKEMMGLSFGYRDKEAKRDFQFDDRSARRDFGFTKDLRNIDAQIEAARGERNFGHQSKLMDQEFTGRKDLAAQGFEHERGMLREQALIQADVWQRNRTAARSTFEGAGRRLPPANR